MKDSSPLAFDLIKWRIRSMPYSRMRAIMAELGESDTQLLIGLSRLHDMHFNSLTEDREIFFTEDSAQIDGWHKGGVMAPTMLQMLLTSRIFALDRHTCQDRFEKLMKEDEP